MMHLLLILAVSYDARQITALLEFTPRDGIKVGEVCMYCHKTPEAISINARTSHS